MIQDWTDKRVTVMGLGRFGGGVGVTRWLVARGARVLVTDLAPPEKLAASLQQLSGLDITLRLGRHEAVDFRDADLVVVNPAVPDSSEFLQVARAAGVPITTEMNLFLERCPARCIGVTGSVGKSTVTAMIGHVLEQAVQVSRPPGGEGIARRIWVGGNIGRSLLDALEQITPEDIVVLELSSFQLQRTAAVRWSPYLAVITGVTPNHLDWHGSFAHYLDAKLNIVRFQDRHDGRIVIHDRAELREALERLRGDLFGVWRYRLEGDVPVAEACAAAGHDPQRFRWDGLKLEVPGRHNRENAAAALTVASLLGVSTDAALKALSTFQALPHRLQKVAVRDGVTYFDDSKSTTPEAALTALQAMDRPVLVILGGYDKGSDLQAVAGEAARRARFVACIGTTGPRLAELVSQAGGRAGVYPDLYAAMRACRQRARPGDAVLLSPACASWDQFPDYRARGELFASLAQGRTHQFPSQQPNPGG